MNVTVIFTPVLQTCSLYPDATTGTTKVESALQIIYKKYNLPIL